LPALAPQLKRDPLGAESPFSPHPGTARVHAPPPVTGLAAEEWLLATPDEVCLAFLRAEWDKVAQVTSWYDRGLIDTPDVANQSQNALRRLILGSWRDPLLQRIPGDTQWHRVRFLQDGHLGQLLVIGSSDWVDNRDRNELRRVALRRPQTLRLAPGNWSQPVLWSHDRTGPFSILEGNNRLTSYVQTPQLGPMRVECFVGLSPTVCIWHLPDHAP